MNIVRVCFHDRWYAELENGNLTPISVEEMQRVREGYVNTLVQLYAERK